MSLLFRYSIQAVDSPYRSNTWGNSLVNRLVDANQIENALKSQLLLFKMAALYCLNLTLMAGTVGSAFNIADCDQDNSCLNLAGINGEETNLISV